MTYTPNYRLYMISFENADQPKSFVCLNHEDPPTPHQYRLVKEWLAKHATSPVKETVSAEDFI